MEPVAAVQTIMIRLLRSVNLPRDWTSWKKNFLPWLYNSVTVTTLWTIEFVRWWLIKKKRSEHSTKLTRLNLKRTEMHTQLRCLRTLLSSKTCKPRRKTNVKPLKRLSLTLLRPITWTSTCSWTSIKLIWMLKPLLPSNSNRKSKPPNKTSLKSWTKSRTMPKKKRRTSRRRTNRTSHKLTRWSFVPTPNYSWLLLSYRILRLKSINLAVRSLSKSSSWTYNVKSNNSLRTILIRRNRKSTNVIT